MSSPGGGGGKVKETELQKTRTDIGAKYFEDYQKRWRPARQVYRARALNEKDSNAARVRGLATGAVDAAFGDQAGNVTKTLAMRGAGIGSGKSALAAADSMEKQAQARGLAEVSADQAAKDIEYSQKQGLTAIGRGDVAQSSAGLNALSTLSGQQAENDANIALQKNLGVGQLIGTGLGVGASALMAGNGGGDSPLGSGALMTGGGAPGANAALADVPGYNPNGFGG